MLVEVYVGVTHTGQIWIKDPLQDLPVHSINNEHLTEIFIREGAMGKLLR